jgi:transcriptional regulator
MANMTKIIDTALTGLKPRQKEVLEARFGLVKEGEGETLAAIGDRLKVTRERVRQIETSGITLAKANIMKSDETIALLEKVKKYVAGRGGVSKKEDVVQFAAPLAKGVRENQLDFLAEVSGAFKLYREDENFASFYYGTEKDLKEAKSFVDNWVGFLKSHKDKVLDGSYQAQFAGFVKTKGVADASAQNYLGIAKHIRKNPYGDTGLRDWPEILPMTVRDKFYLVLKKKEAPLHFEDIARHINKVKFDDQEALAPTVHNELIKDERFVLVGRGMYGLRENGYEPGTAREVIAKVLKSQGPLRPTDVVTHVNKQRFFKENTILINLQNRNFFERMNDGRYRVREA